MIIINWLIESGWQDSNLRPPRPKRGAITGLRYTPRPCNKVILTINSGETGIRTLATVTRRQISNLLHYHSGTSPITRGNSRLKNAVANVIFYKLISQHFQGFFCEYF